jgi:hypothetical protein
MAEKPTYAVSGPGKFARPAKVSEAGGAAYGERAQLASLEAGAPTPSAQPETPRFNPTPLSVPSTTDVPLTQGAGGQTPGAGPEVLPQVPQGLDDTSILVRAMYLANPSPQNRRLLELFQLEDR